MTAPHSRRLLIVSTLPGLRVAGVQHPARAFHAADAFTADELRRLVSSPALTLVLVEDSAVLTPDHPLLADPDIPRAHARDDPGETSDPVSPGAARGRRTRTPLADALG